MENKKKAKVDYAAIIREFEMYGRGRSLKQFCDDSSYVYPNVVLVHISFSNGMELSLYETDVNEITALLHKIVG